MLINVQAAPCSGALWSWSCLSSSVIMVSSLGSCVNTCCTCLLWWCWWSAFRVSDSMTSLLEAFHLSWCHLQFPILSPGGVWAAAGGANRFIFNTALRSWTSVRCIVIILIESSYVTACSHHDWNEQVWISWTEWRSQKRMLLPHGYIVVCCTGLSGSLAQLSSPLRITMKSCIGTRKGTCWSN